MKNIHLVANQVSATYCIDMPKRSFLKFCNADFCNQISTAGIRDVEYDGMYGPYLWFNADDEITKNAFVLELQLFLENL